VRAAVLRPYLDEDVLVFAKLPDGLGFVGKEGRRSSEQPLVPLNGCSPFFNRYSREEVVWHVRGF
jgi:hypothetical protein